MTNNYKNQVNNEEITEEEAMKNFLSGENVFILNTKTSMERVVLDSDEMELNENEIYIK